MTCGSSLKTCGSGPASASSNAPKTQPATSDQPIVRTAAPCAVAASPAPSARPTSTCAAIAIESSTSAANTYSPIAI